MTKSKKRRSAQTTFNAGDDRASRVEVTAVTGSLAGAAVGAVAGPPGVVAGAVIGGVAGALTGLGVADDAQWRHGHAAALDDAIGVTAGDLGAASPDLPPARIGAFSSGSAGVSAARHSTPSEGPMQDIDD
jgi:hypothetical protein